MHNLNGAWIEPRYLGFASYADFADLAKLINASRALPWLLSGLGHVASGFAMVVLSAGAWQMYRDSRPSAALLALCAGLLAAGGFLLLGLSHVIGRQTLFLLADANPALREPAYMTATVVRIYFNGLAQVGLGWFAVQLSWCGMSTPTLPVSFGCYGYLSGAAGLLMAVAYIPVYLFTVLVWSLWLGVLLLRRRFIVIVCDRIQADDGSSLKRCHRCGSRSRKKKHASAATTASAAGCGCFTCCCFISSACGYQRCSSRRTSISRWLTRPLVRRRTWSTSRSWRYSCGRRSSCSRTPTRLCASRLDWLLVHLDVLQLAIKHSGDKQNWLKSLLTEMRDQSHNSGMRVQAHMISAGQNVVFAGRDVNIVSQYYQGNKATLNAYLSALRATWNQPELGSVLPGHNPYTMGLIRLHQLYTYVDVWRNNTFQVQDLQQLTNLRFRAIDADLTDLRSSVLEKIASEPLVVVTGGPGTGKSALCRFIVTCLAYACDPEAERRDNVSGLTLLGSAWIHG